MTLVLLLAGTLLWQQTAPADSAQPVRDAQAPTVQIVPETEIDRLTRQIASSLRCPVCQGLSLQDSPSEMAQEMRALIREKLEAGESPAQIRQYFVGRYGEWALLEPEPRGFNLAVYVLPIIAVLVGGVIVILAARRWLRRPASATDSAAIDEPDPEFAPWD